MKWLDFLNFWQNGHYNGKGYSTTKKLWSRFMCYKERHIYCAPFPVGVNNFDKMAEFTVKCTECGFEKTFIREISPKL